MIVGDSMFTGATCGEAARAPASTIETSAKGIKRRDILRARRALWISRMGFPLSIVWTSDLSLGKTVENASLEGFHRMRTSCGIPRMSRLVRITRWYYVSAVGAQGEGAWRSARHKEADS